MSRPVSTSNCLLTWRIQVEKKDFNGGIYANKKELAFTATICLLVQLFCARVIANTFTHHACVQTVEFDHAQ